MLKYQFGFQKNLSAPHQVYRITELLTKARLSKISTAAIFLDIARAFDRVWIDALIHKLINYNFPTNLVKLLNSYLNDRTFQVRINSSLSSKFNVYFGIMQGSVLGPVLFNLFINDFPIHHSTHVAIYADDTAIFSQNRNINYAIKTLNNHMLLVSEWLNKWRIKVNTDKCIAAIFTTKQRTSYVNNNIYLNNTRIPWSDTVKYLGVTLDKNLTFKQHINNCKINFVTPNALSTPLSLAIARWLLKIKFSYMDRS